VDERSDGSDGVICGLGAPDSVDALARTSHAGRHILRSSSAFDTQSRQLDPDGLIRNACFERRPLAERAPDHLGVALGSERNIEGRLRCKRTSLVASIKYAAYYKHAWQ
jgi:hypothetical protein